jgi:polar amino acid transport system permease protein
VSSFFTIFHDNFWMFTRAAWMTIQLTAVSLFFATFIGLVVAFMKISPVRALRLIADGYIGLIRGLPLIVQLMFLYYGITALVVLPAFWAGSLALAIHSGAYVAEIFRGSIQSIDKGQYEAARSLGMPYRLAMRRVILPQAARRAIPPLGNQFIIGLKDSSLVAYLGVMELFGTALLVQANSFRALQSFAAAGVYYLVMVVIITLVLKRVEKRLAVTTRTGGSSAKKAMKERLRGAET